MARGRGCAEIYLLDGCFKIAVKCTKDTQSYQTQTQTQLKVKSRPFWVTAATAALQVTTAKLVRDDATIEGRERDYR